MDFEIKNGLLVKYTGSDTDITIPPEVTEIGEKAFSGCRHLKTVILPPKLKKIGANAFLNCASLENLEIPASVKSVGAFAFVGCERLDLTFRGMKTKIPKFGVIDLDANMIIFGPEGSTAQAYAEEKGLTFIALEE